MSLEASLNIVVVQTINSACNSAARKRLHGDDAVRAALQNTRVASLLPPVGTEVFRCLTAASLWELQQHEAARTTRGKREENKEVCNMTMTCQQTITRDIASDRTLNICKNCEKKKNQIPANRHFLQVREATLALLPCCEWCKYKTRSGLKIWTELSTLSSFDRKQERTNPNLPGTWRLGWRSHSSTGIRPLAVTGHHWRSWIPTLSHKRLTMITVRNARAYINVVFLTSDLCLHSRRSLCSVAETSSTGSIHIRPLATWAPPTRWGKRPSGSSATDIFLAHRLRFNWIGQKTKQNYSCIFF